MNHTCYQVDENHFFRQQYFTNQWLFIAFIVVIRTSKNQYQPLDHYFRELVLKRQITSTVVLCGLSIHGLAFLCQKLNIFGFFNFLNRFFAILYMLFLVNIRFFSTFLFQNGKLIWLSTKNWEKNIFIKVLRNWKIFLKALSKRLWKLTIKTKRLWRLKYFSFVNVND